MSENAKTDSLGALFEVLVSKIVRRWPKAHFQVKMIKTDGLETLFEVLMSKNGAVLWRQAHFQVKIFEVVVRSTFAVKIYKIPVFWRTFSSSDVEQLVR